MRSSLKPAALLVLFCLLLLPAPALAGGWAVVTLDTLPGAVTAGEPVSIGFTVRQHGLTPLRVEQIRVSAQNEAGGERLEWIARPEGKAGHFSVEITLPAPGRWTWGVSTGLYPEIQTMPVITVSPEATASQEAPASGSSLPFWAAGLALLGGALLNLRLGRRRWSLALGLTAALVVLVGLLAVPALQTEAGSHPENESLAARGQELFTAKGCVVCHSHAQADPRTRGLSTGAGPNLSAYQASPEFLRSWLKDPAGTRSNATMPNLGLQEDEIEALAAFINAE